MIKSADKSGKVESGLTKINVVGVSLLHWLLSVTIDQEWQYANVKAVGETGKDADCQHEQLGAEQLLDSSCAFIHYSDYVFLEAT